MPEEKVCFVIAPIGPDGSPTRKRSDQILKHVIAPVAGECGYAPVRADNIDRPGIITSQVIQHIFDDPLVIADLAGLNANVLYELALRHALRKPVVQLIDAIKNLPFDIASTRTIAVDLTDPDSLEACKEQLFKQIKAVEKNPELVDNPISSVVEIKSLRQSGNATQKALAEIMSILNEIRADRSSAFGSSQLFGQPFTLTPQPFTVSTQTFTPTSQPLTFGVQQVASAPQPLTFGEVTEPFPHLNFSTSPLPPTKPRRRKTPRRMKNDEA